MCPVKENPEGIYPYPTIYKCHYARGIDNLTLFNCNNGNNVNNCDVCKPVSSFVMKSVNASYRSNVNINECNEKEFDKCEP